MDSTIPESMMPNGHPLCDDLYKFGLLGFINEQKEILDATGRFSHTSIYCLENIELAEDAEVLNICKNISIGIGSRADLIKEKMKISMSMDNYGEWRRNNHALGPFLFVQVDDDLEFNRSFKRYSIHENAVTVRNEFQETRIKNIEKLQFTENKIVISFLQKLSSIAQQNIVAKLITTKYYAKLNDGRILYDAHYEAFNQIDIPIMIEAKKITNSFKESDILSIALCDKSLRLFHAASNEREPLISFMVLWIALETQINFLFTKCKVDEMPNYEMSEFFLSVRKRLYNDENRSTKISSLAQKFLYLSAFSLNISESEFSMFEKCKSARDAFVHGRQEESGWAQEMLKCLSTLFVSLSNKELITG